MAVIRGQRQNVNSNILTPNVMPDVILTDRDLNAAMYLTLNQIFAARKSTPQYEMKWEVDSFLPDSDTVSAAVTSSSDTISVTNGNYFITNDIWYNKRTGEMFKITSGGDSSSNQVRAKRGLGALNSGVGTAGTPMVSGDTIVRLATSVNPENSRAQTTRTTDLTEVVNYTQAMRWDLEMGRRQRKSSFLTGKDWSYQMDKTFLDARKDLSRALLFNEKSKYTDENNVIHTTTQGLFNVPETNKYTVNGTLYKTAFDEWLVEEALRYGSNKWLVTSTAQILAINEMAQGNLEIDYHKLDEKGQIGFEVTKYKAPNGKYLNIVEDRNITDTRNGDGLIIDMDSIEFCHFDGDGISDDLHIESSDAQENDATNSHAFLYCDVGIKWKDEKTLGLLKGVTGGGASGRPVS